MACAAALLCAAALCGVTHAAHRTSPHSTTSVSSTVPRRHLLQAQQGPTAPPAANDPAPPQTPGGDQGSGSSSSADADDDASSSSDEEQPDFSTTANALAKEAVAQADVRLAAAADGGTLGGAGDATVAASDAPAGASTAQARRPPSSGPSLQLLMGSLARQWGAAQNRQQGGGRRQPPDVGVLWAGALDRLASDHPGLSATAGLLRNDALLQVRCVWQRATCTGPHAARCGCWGVAPAPPPAMHTHTHLCGTRVRCNSVFSPG
jgi:hypothetical protein